MGKTINRPLVWLLFRESTWLSSLAGRGLECKNSIQLAELVTLREEEGSIWGLQLAYGECQHLDTKLQHDVCVELLFSSSCKPTVRAEKAHARIDCSWGENFHGHPRDSDTSTCRSPSWTTWVLSPNSISTTIAEHSLRQNQQTHHG